MQFHNGLWDTSKTNWVQMHQSIIVHASTIIVLQGNHCVYTKTSKEGIVFSVYFQVLFMPSTSVFQHKYKVNHVL
ncbi:hypothetical protein P5673_014817 [Acropora cervicornis]|uniref:Uncharacterized protein n=1 Tax=Acropora cervicornis TaxID=6130 RepID=A0AAD9QIU4_ACRCE|nr:hypothetical protein P5673_014817 [Acropora cervicornis]